MLEIQGFEDSAQPLHGGRGAGLTAERRLRPAFRDTPGQKRAPGAISGPRPGWLRGERGRRRGAAKPGSESSTRDGEDARADLRARMSKGRHAQSDVQRERRRFATSRRRSESTERLGLASSPYSAAEGDRAYPNRFKRMA